MENKVESKFLNIGFQNMVALSRVIAIVSPDSAPVKRIIAESKKEGNLIDASLGRRTRSVLIMDSDHVVLSTVQPETLVARIEGRKEKAE
ncbi:MAG: DUF370 domain-containing protein [Selenomonadaceae bacterium]|nr:DUF370 domain-containing protein [Selenomonadaceae bacterium]